MYIVLGEGVTLLGGLAFSDLRLLNELLRIRTKQG